MLPQNATRDISFQRRGLTYHYRYVSRGSGPLFVSFAGWRPPGNLSAQYYARTSWARTLPCSFLFVTDPMFQVGPHVRTSALQGRPDYFMTEDIVDDIRQIAISYGHPEDRFLLYGSSVAGMAAIQAGTYIRNAKVIAECPQIFMRKCHEHLFDLACAVSQLCYDVETARDIPDEFEHRFNLSEAFKRRGAPAYLKLFVRRSDVAHLEKHAKPFVAMFPETELQIMDDRTGSGHTVLTLPEVLPDIQRLLNLEPSPAPELAIL